MCYSNPNIKMLVYQFNILSEDPLSEKNGIVCYSTIFSKMDGGIMTFYHNLLQT